MSQSLARNIVHLVFSTKDRRPLLDDIFRDELHRYAIGIFGDEGCFVLAINSVRDHMHVLFELNKTCALSTAVQQVKQGTSRWLKTKSREHTDFQWQTGYGAFSVSASNIDVVIDYIGGQKEHHATKSFQDEFRALLTRHGIKYDEQYLWT